MAVSSHEKPIEGATNEWRTPLHVVRALGDFDLDPCGSSTWPTATTIWEGEEGLNREWKDRVWLNPPYGPHVGKWLRLLALHGRGTALVFARTETRVFFEWVWPYATGYLFLAGRLHFHDSNGQRAKGNAGAPSVLIAYGQSDAFRLSQSPLTGAYLDQGFITREKTDG